MKSREITSYSIEAATISIALVATIVGAIATFSKLFDSTTLSVIFEKLGGMSDVIKWFIILVAATGIGIVAGYSLYHNSLNKPRQKVKRNTNPS
jgi:type II secretory pathway component PulF